MIFALALLLPAMAAALHPQATGATLPPGTLTVLHDGHSTVLAPADLAKLPRHEIRLPPEGGADSATISGIFLWDLLQAAGTPSSEASGRQRGVMYVRLRGSDGQTALLALAEVDPGFTRGTVLVADRRNGSPLDGTEGPWRVIIPDDMRHARWIRGLVGVELGTLPP